MADIDLEIKYAKALQLRSMGLTFREIAQQLGYESRQGAQQAVKAALKEIREEAYADIKEVDVQRLDILLRSQMRKALAGDSKAADSCVRIIARKCAMLGMDTPAKLALTDPTGDNEYTGFIDPATAARIVAELNARAAEATAGAGGERPALEARPEE